MRPQYDPLSRKKGHAACQAIANAIAVRSILLLLLVIIAGVGASGDGEPRNLAYSPNEIGREAYQHASFSNLLEDVSLEYEAGFLDVTGRLFKRATPVLIENTPMPGDVESGDKIYYQYKLTTAPGVNPPRRRSPIQDFVDRTSEERTSVDEGGEQAEGDVQAHDDLETWKRQDGDGSSRVYISLTVCGLPKFNRSEDKVNPPQPTLYVSPSSQIQEPGPNKNGPDVIEQPLVEGYAAVSTSATGTVYIGIYAPKVPCTGSWNYQVAASTDQPFQGYEDSAVRMYAIDSDSNAALLVTRDLNETFPAKNFTKWTEAGPPLSIFVSRVNDTSINGIRHSFCGLQRYAQISGLNVNPEMVELSFTTLYGGKQEQQFYVPGLENDSAYYGILAQTGNSTDAGPDISGGGGMIFSTMNFTTKKQANCGVIFNLEFCDWVAYAVPANPGIFPNASMLAAHYDNYTKAAYQNFDYSLQQIPCNTTPSAQYSLAKTCDDCAAAYKTWLCAVSIPRCADWIENPGIPRSSNDFGGSRTDGKAYLMPRNAAQKPIPETPDIAPVTNETLLGWLATNSSRNNHTIATQVQPGPYLEVLPCEDLCWNLVRSCPAALGFGCPYPGRGLEISYGTKVEGGNVTCNEPGALVGLSAGSRSRDVLSTRVYSLLLPAVISLLVVLT